MYLIPYFLMEKKKCKGKKLKEKNQRKNIQEKNTEKNTRKNTKNRYMKMTPKKRGINEYILKLFKALQYNDYDIWNFQYMMFIIA